MPNTGAVRKKRYGTEIGGACSKERTGCMETEECGREVGCDGSESVAGGWQFSPDAIQTLVMRISLVPSSRMLLL